MVFQKKKEVTQSKQTIVVTNPECKPRQNTRIKKSNAAKQKAYRERLKAKKLLMKTKIAEDKINSKTSKEVKAIKSDPEINSEKREASTSPEKVFRKESKFLQQKSNKKESQIKIQKPYYKRIKFKKKTAEKDILVLLDRADSETFKEIKKSDSVLDIVFINKDIVEYSVPRDVFEAIEARNNRTCEEVQDPLSSSTDSSYKDNKESLSLEKLQKTPFVKVKSFAKSPKSWKDTQSLQ